MEDSWSNYWYVGFLVLPIGIYYFISEGKKMINRFEDKDYILASNSISKFGSSIILILIGLILLNQKLKLL
jgi:hypothetical protein